MSSPGAVEVRILELPVVVWADTQEYYDDLLREFALLAAANQQGIDHTPAQLLALVEELQRDYDQLSVAQSAQLAMAVEAGRSSLDLTYLVPVGVADACRRVDEAFDAADAYCRAGDYLLSLACPPEATMFRRWFLGEFVRQVEGQPPCPWPAWRRRAADQPTS